MANDDKPESEQICIDNENNEDHDCVVDFIHWCGVDENGGGLEDLSKSDLEMLCRVLLIAHDTNKQYKHVAKEMHIIAGELHAINKESTKNFLAFSDDMLSYSKKMKAITEQNNETIRRKNSHLKEAMTIIDFSLKELKKLDERIICAERKKVEIAKNAAKARHAEDPKQAAKAAVKEHWIEWQKDPARYKSAAAFASAMMDKFNDPNNEKPILENQAVITRWCREWKKEQDNTHPA